MNEVAKQTHLIRRGAVYYFRARVPSDIIDSYGKKEEYFSLQTKDYQAAIRLVRKEAAKVEAKFERHRRELARQSLPALETITKDQLKFIEDTYYHHLLEEDEETRLHGFFSGVELEAPAPAFDEYKTDTEDLTAITREGYAQGNTEVFFHGEATEVLSWDSINLKLKEGSLAFKQVAMTLQKATIRAYESIQSRNEGGLVDTPENPKGGLSDSPVESGTPLLSDVMEEWMAEKTRTSWTDKTARAHRVWVTRFIELTGNRPITGYTKSDAREYKSVILKLPPNWTKVAAIKELSIKDAATKAEKLALLPMSDTNINKILRFTGSIWNWIIRNYDDVTNNPFTGMNISIKSQARDERFPFTQDELKAIFSAPVYTGCLSESKWQQSGTYSMKDTAKYWVPLIGLFSGARLGEILQLHIEDIKQEGGIHYLDINADQPDKTLKTNSSKRIIPIHRTLIGMGLIALVEKRKAKGEHRLFPEITKGNDGTYSHAFSGHFRRFLTALGIKHQKNSFHSFRHTFEDACRNSGVPKEIMDALQGHKEQGMSGRYGSGYSLEVLNEGLQKVDYGEFKFKL
tara:strand:+ start:113 stop:1831 length:1719 start_codon:yes stop_codon:yes gene_type:complete